MAKRKRPLVSLNASDTNATPFEYQSTDEELTASAGLSPILDLLLSHPLFPELVAALPKRISNASYATETFAVILLAGFLYGYDCLEDLEQFQYNPLIVERFGIVPTAKAFGDWLRDFGTEELDKLYAFLLKHAQYARSQIDPKGEHPFVQDMDSTSHIQSGVKMEGVAYDYAGNWCLSSLSSSDELGFSYAFELRPGNTFSSQGAAPMMRSTFAHLKFSAPKFFRADSAFCNQECVEEAVRLGAKFTITAHGNTEWEARAGQITSWIPWQWTSEELKAFQDKKEQPPQVELGSMLYQPGWSENLRFYMVVKRTWRYDSRLNRDRWFYYAVLTNWDLFRNSLQSAMEFHHGRGAGENVIREHKYAYDLKHFPCQKLSANQVYGIFALIAHNHLRTIALLDNREHPLYAKRLRFKLIYQPGKIVSHARRKIIKFAKKVGEEVQAMFTAWAATRMESALARAG
jgi:hypothetical protein